MSAKSWPKNNKELKDGRSYARWKGKDYLLPGVKERHVSVMTNRSSAYARAQQQKYLNLAEAVRKAKNKLKKSQIERKNMKPKQIKNGQHIQNITPWMTAGVWLLFELVLSYFLAYPWVYLFYCKKELLVKP